MKCHIQWTTPFNVTLIHFNCRVQHAKLSGFSWQQWNADRTEAEGAPGEEVVAEVGTTATVLAVTTGEEGEEATTAAGARETTTGPVDAEGHPVQRTSITGWESVEVSPTGSPDIPLCQTPLKIC